MNGVRVFFLLLCLSFFLFISLSCFFLFLHRDRNKLFSLCLTTGLLSSSICSRNPKSSLSFHCLSLHSLSLHLLSFPLIGQMTREKFFERLFQSNYFQEFLGLLPATRSASNSSSHASSNSDDSGSLINLPHATIPPLLVRRISERERSYLLSSSSQMSLSFSPRFIGIEAVR